MHKQRVALGVGINMLVELFNKVSPLFILHHVQRHLPVAQFGYAQFSMSLIDLALPFVLFGYNTVGSIEIAKIRDDPQKCSEWISALLLLKLIHGAIAFGLLWSLTRWIPRYEVYHSAILALGFVIFFGSIEMHHVHVACQRMASFGIFTGLAKILSFISILIWVDKPEDALTYAILTMGANSLINFCTFFYINRIYRITRPQMATVRFLWKKSLPFAWVLLFLAMAERFDTVIANLFLGDFGVGLYTGPLRISQSLYSLFMSVSVVFFSELVNTTDKQDFNRHLRAGLWVSFAVLAPILTGIWFVDQSIVQFILGEHFQSVSRLLSVFALTVGAHALISIFGFQLLLLHGCFRFMTLTLFLAGAGGIVLAYFTAGPFALYGIAVSVLIAKLSAALAMAWRSRVFLDRFPFAELSRVFIPAGGMGAILYLAGLENFWLILLLAVASYALFFAASNLALLRANLGFFKR